MVRRPPISNRLDPLFPYTTLVRSDDLLTLKFAVLAGAGICVLPDYMCDDEINDGRLVRVLPDWAPRPGIVHAVFASRRGMVPAVRAFLDFLGEHMRPRSEEHTSALQSLMRNSYPVFCLKKKN